MSKGIIIGFVNLGIVLLHAMALLSVYFITQSTEEVAKLTPPTLASLIATSAATTLALIHIIKSQDVGWECTVGREDWRIRLTVHAINTYSQKIELTNVSVPLFTSRADSGDFTAQTGAALCTTYFLVPIGNPDTNTRLSRRLRSKRHFVAHVSYKWHGSSETFNDEVPFENPFQYRRFVSRIKAKLGLN